VAEDTGLIVELGTQVLRIACHQLRAWREYAPDLQLAVNLSARKAARADLCDIVQTALIDAGLPAEALALELTESVLLESARSTLGKLGELRRSGVQIGIDDFGTGYASLRYLRELPVTFLKVDRSFVAGMTTNHHDAVIVQTVTRLARDLGLGCIARRHRNRSTAATHPGDRSPGTRLPVRARRPLHRPHAPHAQRKPLNAMGLTTARDLAGHAQARQARRYFWNRRRHAQCRRGSRSPSTAGHRSPQTAGPL
jgi:hypothetical protein